MKRYRLIALMPILGLVFTAAEAEKGITWRDVLAVAGIVAPIIFAIIIYLIRKRIQAEKELQDSKLDDLKQQFSREHQQQKEILTRLQKELDEAQKGLAEAQREVLTHQTACAGKYVDRNTYNNDLQAQKDHLATLKDLIKQQAEAVDRLVKLF